MVKKSFRLTFMQDALGSAPGNPKIYEDYIASKAPEGKTVTDEIEAIGEDGVRDKMMTVFPRNELGQPIFWDYQIKGFLKDACSMMRQVEGTESSKIKNYKKVIDGLVFVYPRRIPIRGKLLDEPLQRSLRAQTAQGERIALAMSEVVAEGSYIDIEIECMREKDFDWICELLHYGCRRGLGQWRNAGFGKFEYKETTR